MTFRLSICCSDPDLKGLELGELKYLLCAVGAFDRFAGFESSAAFATPRFSPLIRLKKGDCVEETDGMDCEDKDCVGDWKAAWDWDRIDEVRVGTEVNEGTGVCIRCSDGIDGVYNG